MENGSHLGKRKGFFILSIQYLITLTFLWKYLLLFPITVIEGPIITILSGFLVSSGHLNAIAAFVMIIAGELTGDSISYKIGSMSKGYVPEKWGRLFGIRENKVKKAELLFHRHKTKALLIGKWSHVIGLPILVAAGMAGIPFKQFIGVNFLAAIPKTLLLMILGYYFGQYYKTIASYLNYTTVAAAGVGILTAILLVLYKKSHKKRMGGINC
jgi:membrane-associated protein